MSTLETLDVEQASELKLAFRRTGWNNEEVKRLCEGTILADIRSVILGQAEVRMLEHIIDCDPDPFVPNGLTVEEHQKSGLFKWNPAAVQFYLSDSQQQQREGKLIYGHKIREELAGKPVLNANVLDYLFAHQYLIPESWKEKTDGCITHVFFWGTIYRRPGGGGLPVRYLCWDGGRWRWYYNWLGRVWYGYYPAALRAS